MSGEQKREKPTLDANARLIAAAPELLACVERAYTLEKANHGMTSHAYAYEAALRQAKGETP